MWFWGGEMTRRLESRCTEYWMKTTGETRDKLKSGRQYGGKTSKTGGENVGGWGEKCLFRPSGSSANQGGCCNGSKSGRYSSQSWADGLGDPGREVQDGGVTCRSAPIQAQFENCEHVWQLATMGVRQELKLQMVMWYKSSLVSVQWQYRLRTLANKLGFFSRVFFYSFFIYIWWLINCLEN